MLTEEQIQKHYLRKDIMDTIIRVSTDGDYSRAACKRIPKVIKDKITGDLIDSMDWYHGNGAVSFRKELHHIDLSKKNEYARACHSCRSLYWSLNVFKKSLYETDFKPISYTQEGKKNSKSTSTVISRTSTAGYTFGIDIDKGKGCNIHDPEIKEATEAMAQYFSDYLKKYVPNSVYVAYSGGGIYVLVHHKVFQKYFEEVILPDNTDTKMLAFLKALDKLISTIRKDFEELHPEYIGKVKPDELNGSKRVFKTLFSIHASLDYAVIPLDPNNIKIDFEKSKLPLSQDVINSAKDWYSKYDDGAEFIEKCLLPNMVAEEKKIKRSHKSIEHAVNIPTAEVPIDMTKWAPCMLNLYNLPSCGEGATRALAVFASFLGQIGIDEQNALDLFNGLANRWGARTENIFTSYFRVMKVPTCTSLNADPNIGFPKGCSLKRLNVCKPNAKCLRVPSPRYYTDDKAEKTLLLSRLQKDAGKTPA